MVRSSIVMSRAEFVRTASTSLLTFNVGPLKIFSSRPNAKLLGRHARSTSTKPLHTARKPLSASLQTPNHAPSVSDATNALFREIADASELSNSQIDDLMTLTSMLNHTSSLYNLTAIRKPDDIVQKHIIDALTLLPFLDKEDPKSIIDIGSGAGFPGLVLAIARPHWYITLLESVRKKTLFHLDVMERLPLTNVTSEWDRAESFARENGIRESFCIAVARSVAEMRVLAEFSLPLVKVGGCLVAQKSLDSERLEISAAERSIRTCGGSSAQVIPPSLKPFKSYNEEEDERGRKKCLVVVRKVGPTPLTYPRRPGVPKQTPL